MGRERVYKKIFFDIDAEEDWLESVAADGCRLTKVEQTAFGARYRFEETDKEYQYRVDYSRDGAVMEEITAPYVLFVTSSCGAEYIGYANGKVYFRKAKENGDFPPLYSDLQGRIDREKKVFWQQLGFSFVFLIGFIFCGYTSLEWISAGRMGASAVMELVASALEAVCTAIYGFFAFMTARRISRLKKRSNV